MDASSPPTNNFDRDRAFADWIATENQHILNYCNQHKLNAVLVPAVHVQLNRTIGQYSIPQIYLTAKYALRIETNRDDCWDERLYECELIKLDENGSVAELLRSTAYDDRAQFYLELPNLIRNAWAYIPSD